MEGKEEGKGSFYRVSQWKTLGPFQRDSLPCSTDPGGISIRVHYLQVSSKQLKKQVFANASSFRRSEVRRGWHLGRSRSVPVILQL